MHPQSNAELARLYASDRIADATLRRRRDTVGRHVYSVRRRLSLIAVAAKARS